ncbi:MAG TPA: trehalase-like domain-containing protein, partial [Polyangiaceae bacterium]|nr:trehalase-like domain-containing protein [Polyangiaceae bacterium]
MALAIEDYALIGDTQSAALIGRDGSCDWLCLPRFDSPACFAALLGDPEHGRWLLAPRRLDVARTERRYRDGTLILETTFVCGDGRVRIIDFMPPRDTTPDLVRIVEGLDGEVAMRMELTVRFDYGSIVPWVRRLDETRLHAIGGADGLLLEVGASTHPEGLATCSDFTVKPGQRVPFVLSWHPSHRRPPRSIDPFGALQETERWWHEWASHGVYRGPWQEAVSTSLLVLKALTYAPTGGIVAAPTTSLPEHPGGVRNWDYRYCWLRDATYTLDSLTLAGHRQEAEAWRDWLLRAVAGDPSKLQIMY